MRVIAYDGSVDIAYENAVFYTEYINREWCVCAKFFGNVNEFEIGRYGDNREYCMRLINNLHHYYLAGDKVFVFPDKVMTIPKFSEY